MVSVLVKASNSPLSRDKKNFQGGEINRMFLESIHKDHAVEADCFTFEVTE